MVLAALAGESSLVLARLAYLSAHEVGHTLGLDHNWAATTFGWGSVMDYLAPNLQLHDGTLDLSDGSTTTYACAGGSCDANTGTCVAGFADGQACNYNEQCSSGWCRQAVCGGPPKLGDPCGFDGDCGDALACINNACASLPGAGQPCPDFRCAPGSTCQPMTVQGVPDQYVCVDEGPWLCPGG